MSTAPSLTVHAAPGAQTVATTTRLDRAGVEYETVPADALRTVWTDADGVTHKWSGFRTDRLDEAVAGLRATV